MASAHVQGRGISATAATSISHSYASNITNGNLALWACIRTNATNDAMVVGDASKSAGTSTIGTIVLDKLARATGAVYRVDVGSFSAPITGTGSCTIQVSGHPTGSYILLVVAEASGTDVTSSRLEASNSATGTSTTPDSGNATSAGDAYFFAAYGDDGTLNDSITPDGSFTQIYEMENGNTDTRGSVIYRTTTTGLTDSGSWTLASSNVWGATVCVYKVAGSAVVRPQAKILSQAVARANL